MNNAEIEKANEIIKAEGWDKPDMDPKATLATINSKYPEHKEAIGLAMVKRMLKSIGDDENVMSLRKHMHYISERAIHMVSSHNKAFRDLGVSPFINDTHAYKDMSQEESDKLTAEDYEMGRKMYNCCAEYCRIYNEAKLVMEDNERNNM